VLSQKLKDCEEIIPDLYLEIESLRRTLQQEQEHRAALEEARGEGEKARAAQEARHTEECKRVKAALLAAEQTAADLTSQSARLKERLQCALDTAAAKAAESQRLARSLAALRSRLLKMDPPRPAMPAPGGGATMRIRGVAGETSRGSLRGASSIEGGSENASVGSKDSLRFNGLRPPRCAFAT
jgi:small-conductance mechanosensitive channel